MVVGTVSCWHHDVGSNIVNPGNPVFSVHNASTSKAITMVTEAGTLGNNPLLYFKFIIRN